MTKVKSIRVKDSVWDQWRQLADTKGVSVVDLLRESVERERYDVCQVCGGSGRALKDQVVVRNATITSNKPVKQKVEQPVAEEDLPTLEDVQRVYKEAGLSAKPKMKPDDILYGIEKSEMPAVKFQTVPEDEPPTNTQHPPSPDLCPHCKQAPKREGWPVCMACSKLPDPSQVKRSGKDHAA